MTTADEFLDAISNVQRRRLLVHMLFNNPEDESKLYTGDGETNDEELTALLIEMEHVHLPKLEDYGFIEWNRDEHVVVKGPKFDEVRPFLELLVDHQDELPDGWL